MITPALSTHERLAQLHAEIMATPHNPRATVITRRSFIGATDLILLRGSRQECMGAARALVDGQGWTLFAYLIDGSTTVLHLLRGAPHHGESPGA